MTQFENIPVELTALPQWVCYGRRGTSLGDREYKIPIDPRSGYGAKAGQPDTWATFTQAKEAVQAGRFTGVGFEFAEGGGIVGIDFDHCRDPETGAVNAWAQKWVDALNSYTEISPSGTGLHILVRGELPGSAIKRPQAEMYLSGRYFTVTGNIYGVKRLLRPAPEAVKALYAELVKDAEKGRNPAPLPTDGSLEWDAEIGGNQSFTPVLWLDDQMLIEKATNAKNGSLFASLYAGEWQRSHKSQSEADLAFCNMLAFWSGGDPEQMDRIFRVSNLMRPKWDELHGWKTYGQITIERAVADLKDQYMGHYDNIANIPPEENPPGLQHIFSPFGTFVPFDHVTSSANSCFPVDSLPPALRDYAQALAESLQVSEDMTGPICLTLAAVAVQKKFMVNPKPGWHEPLNLYTVIIASPSERKSPALKAACKPIHDFVARENELRAPAIREYIAKRNALQSQLRSMEEQISKPSNTRTDTGAPRISIADIADKHRELDELKEVHPLRLLADDATPEALFSLMAENDGMISVISAEGGIFDIVSGRYSDKPNVEIILKAFTGEPAMVDRKGRQSEYLPSPAMTMLLMVQPSVLQGIMQNNVFRGRGFLARLFYALPHSCVGSRRYETTPVPESVEEAYRVQLHSLLSLPVPDKPEAIGFSAEAHAVSKAHFEELEKRLVDDLECIENWAGKFHGQVMRIAGILHCCKYTVSAAKIEMEAETVQQAIAIGNFFLDHALTAFGECGAADTQDEQDAKYILKRIDSTGKAEVTKRELQRLCRGKFSKAEKMEPGLEELKERGYICIETIHTGGRPTEKIILNPLYLQRRCQGQK